MKIYLIRHGQTEWNKDRKLQGSMDIPLNETGIDQAKKLADKLKRYNIEHIYTSPLSRAFDTAQEIKKVFGCSITQLDSLKEIDFGIWQGHTVAENKAIYGGLVARWEQDPTFDAGYGIESYFSVQQRAYQTLTEIGNGVYDEVAVITHGAWIKSVICKLLHIPLSKRFCFDVGNTSFNILDYNKEHGKFQVKTLNEVSHLERYN